MRQQLQLRSPQLRVRVPQAQMLWIHRQGRAASVHESRYACCATRLHLVLEVHKRNARPPRHRPRLLVPCRAEGGCQVATSVPASTTPASNPSPPATAPHKHALHRKCCHALLQRCAAVVPGAAAPLPAPPPIPGPPARSPAGHQGAAGASLRPHSNHPPTRELLEQHGQHGFVGGLRQVLQEQHAVGLPHVHSRRSSRRGSRLGRRALWPWRLAASCATVGRKRCVVCVFVWWGWRVGWGLGTGGRATSGPGQAATSPLEAPEQGMQA